VREDSECGYFLNDFGEVNSEAIVRPVDQVYANARTQHATQGIHISGSEFLSAVEKFLEEWTAGADLSGGVFVHGT
jgi:hypothetical protein